MSIYGFGVWFTTVAIWIFFIIVFGSVNFGFIVAGYNRFDVIHAGVVIIWVCSDRKFCVVV